MNFLVCCYRKPLMLGGLCVPGSRWLLNKLISFFFLFGKLFSVLPGQSCPSSFAVRLIEYFSIVYSVSQSVPRRNVPTSGLTILPILCKDRLLSWGWPVRFCILTFLFCLFLAVRLASNNTCSQARGSWRAHRWVYSISWVYLRF